MENAKNAEAGASEVLSIVSGLVERQDDSQEEREMFTGSYYISPDAPLPSVSPRDRLSYQDDKRIYKEQCKFQNDHPHFSKLLCIMETEILRAKPVDIVRFLTEEFFAERNQTSIRKVINEKADNVMPT